MPSTPLSSPAPADRRELLKLRNRRAIIDAAGALAEEKGLGGFTIAELAERADVSKRTIFNHFASGEEAVYARLAELLGGIVDNFVSVAEPNPIDDHRNLGSIFEQVAAVIQSADLLGPLNGMMRLGRSSQDHPSTLRWTHEVMQTVTSRLTAEVARRNPGADQFAIRILASALVNAVGTTFEAWGNETGGVDNAATRERWDALLSRAVDFLRHGFSH
jgi:TetR/AcrR family transcriptional regulator, regulator of autoinduction and epiphytic fitness